MADGFQGSVPGCQCDIRRSEDSVECTLHRLAVKAGVHLKVFSESRSQR